MPINLSIHPARSRPRRGDWAWILGYCLGAKGGDPVRVLTVLAIGALLLLGALVQAQVTEEELAGWAFAHWEAVGQGDAGAVAAGFSPEGGIAFLGVPGLGFHRGTAVLQGWEAFFSLFPVQGYALRGEARVSTPARLVYGTLELAVPGGVVAVDCYLRFGPDGKIIGADYVVAGGPAAPSPDGTIMEGEYFQGTQDPRSGVSLFWRNGLVVLFVALRAPGTGWVSAGFDPVNRMQGANYIMAAVTPEGLVIEDHFGTGTTSHRRDARQDILRAAGTISGGQTVVEFVIPLDSGDPEDKPLVPGRTYTVLLAYHRSSTSFTVIHTARGSVQMKLEE